MKKLKSKEEVLNVMEITNDINKKEFYRKQLKEKVFD